MKSRVIDALLFVSIIGHNYVGMKPSVMNLMKFAIGLSLPLIALFVVVLAMWGHDVWNDRRHTVVVRTETPIFAGSGEGCDGTRMTTAFSNTTFRVKRIRYWKACATIDVVLSDGRKGHILLGEGDVSISPPLP